MKRLDTIYSGTKRLRGAGILNIGMMPDGTLRYMAPEEPTAQDDESQTLALEGDQRVMEETGGDSNI